MTTRWYRSLFPLVLGGLMGCSPGVATPAPPITHVLVGAGDIARCGALEDEATALLLSETPGMIFTVGDNVYPSGTAEEFERCYGPSWGWHKSRTRPTPGNHDYASHRAIPYFDYFGSAAGESLKGHYSYDMGAWHIVALNSICGREEGRCEVGTEQEGWLRADLAADDHRCTLAYWHHPLFSSGWHGGDRRVGTFWDLLYEEGAEVVLSGNDHDYERFAPQDPAGTLDEARGIRQFVVGTGGAALREFREPRPNSEVRNADSHGVLKVTLLEDGYEWEFLPIAGDSFTDSGSGSCH